MDDFIAQYEKTIAGYLERSLNKTKIRLWADAFSSNENTRVKSQLFFGFARGSFGNPIFNPVTQETDSTELLTFELQAVIYTLHNHQEALTLIRSAVKCLKNYRPFDEIEPIRPVDYGDVRFNKNDGSWLYSGKVTATAWDSIEQLTPIEEVAEPQIVQVGLYNSGAAEVIQRDRVWGNP